MRAASSAAARLLLRALELALALVAKRLSLAGCQLADAGRGLLRLCAPALELGARGGQHRLALGGGLGQAPVRVPHRLGASLGGLGGGVADDALRGQLGLGADLGRRLAGGREHARGLLAEDLEQHRLVWLVRQTEPRLGALRPLPQLGRLAMEAVEQRRDLVQEGPHLLLLVAAAGDLEGAAGDGVAVERVGHGAPMLRPTLAVSVDALAAGADQSAEQPAQEVVEQVGDRVDHRRRASSGGSGTMGGTVGVVGGGSVVGGAAVVGGAVAAATATASVPSVPSVPAPPPRVWSSGWSVAGSDASGSSEGGGLLEGVEGVLDAADERIRPHGLVEGDDPPSGTLVAEGEHVAPAGDEVAAGARGR